VPGFRLHLREITLLDRGELGGRRGEGSHLAHLRPIQQIYTSILALQLEIVVAFVAQKSTDLAPVGHMDRDVSRFYPARFPVERSQKGDDVVQSFIRQLESGHTCCLNAIGDRFSQSLLIQAPLQAARAFASGSICAMALCAARCELLFAGVRVGSQPTRNQKQCREQEVTHRVHA
jgi:hypothetical protein